MLSKRTAFEGTPDRLRIDYMHNRGVREVVDGSRRMESFNEN
jgi:hypothetical protein